MSVRIDRWFGVPPELFESGHFARLSHSAVRLFIFLYWKHDRQSNRQFQESDRQITLQAGVSARSLSSARKQLAQTRILRFERAPGGMYTYTLCDLKTGEPYPGDPREKVRFVKGQSPAKPKSSLPEREIEPLKSKVELADEDTDFKFGHNAPESTGIDPQQYNPFR